MVRRLAVVAFIVLAILALSAAFGIPGPSDRLAEPTTLTSLPRIAPATPAPTSAPPTTVVPVALPARDVPLEPKPDPDAPPPSIADGFVGIGVVTIPLGGADLISSPGEAPFVRARQGLVFPAQGQDGDWIRILTMCDEEAWVNVAEVHATAPEPPREIGAGFSMRDAVVVIDPGHGGPNIGTSSPDGSLLEKAVNVDIALRVRDLLEMAHTVDWETGTLYVGDAVPAVKRVLMTRVGSGESADYEAGLIYRARLANASGGNVMVSIHNNAGWEVSLSHPGSDVYYQSQLEASRRLGELLVEEFQRSFAQFEADWVGAIEWGAKSRLSARDGVSQYYGILRRSQIPTVIAEGAYLANPTEAALLATPEFRQAYAGAVYRAIVRFLTTDDVAATPSFDPIVWAGFAGSGDPVSTCTVPAQGE